ncbi:MAG: NYN domain-containing protein [Methanomassiliicoccales archaeon]|nr:NYN domain-containing protein [Methanomassiliicoccales archaeon]NYT16038.1 NYN domain-containing protein [Methanomassiliicoccales archaeon]
MSEDNIAIYLDFENLAISASDYYPSLSKPLRIDHIMDFAANKGNLCIKKAYADWSREPNRSYASDLMEYAFELVHLPNMTARGKNAADLRMSMDAMEDMQNFSTITRFIIGSGDTDFIHLIRRIQQRGKYAVVIGFEQTVGRTIKDNCNEFKSMEELMGDFGKKAEEEIDYEWDEAKDILIRYIRGRSSEAPVLMSTLKEDLLRLQPSFSEKKLGFRSFREFVEAQDALIAKIIGDPASGQLFVKLKTWDEVATMTQEIDINEVSDFLFKNLRFQRNPEVRNEIYMIVLKMFERKEAITLDEMGDRVMKVLKRRLTKIEIKNFLFTLGQGRLFKFANIKYSGSKYTMPQVLIDNVPDLERIDSIYLQRNLDLVLRQFPGISMGRVMELMGQ